jgi:hypothetical protein
MAGLTSREGVVSKIQENLRQFESRPIAEGRMTRAIEGRTAKVPSMAFLFLAIGSIAASATFAIMRRRETGIFIGLWAPTFLLLGIYNKLVKLTAENR